MSVINTRTFWPILARFMDYYSQFWGPGVNSTINEPRSAFSCRSLALTVFVDCDPFCGLLLTVLGVPMRFPWFSNPKVCLRVGRQGSQFGRIWPVSWTITQFWGPEVISTIDEHRGAFKCQSSTLIILANSGPFRRLLLTVLGS